MNTIELAAVASALLVVVATVAVPVEFPDGAGDVVRIDGCTTIDDPGTYVLTGDVTDPAVGPDTEACIRITASDVTLRGNGHTLGSPGDSPDYLALAVRVFREDGRLSNVTLRNLRVEGSWNQVTTVSRVDGVRIEEVTVDGGSAYGRRVLGVFDSSNVAVTDVRVADTEGGTGIDVQRTDGVRIADSTVANVRRADAVSVDDSTDVVVADNVVRGNDTFGSGIVLRSVTGGSIVGNELANVSSHGVELEGRNYTVADNRLVDVGERGILVGGGGNVTVRDNLIREDGGIRIDAPNSRVVDNTVVGDSTWRRNLGVIDVDSDGNLVARNVVRNVSMGNGIDVHAADDNRVVGNVVENVTDEGITVWSSDDDDPSVGTVVRNNTVSMDGGKRGIFLLQATDTLVAGNDVSGARHGIYVGGFRRNDVSHDNRLVDNRVTRNDRTGIRLQHTGGHRVEGNVVQRNPVGIHLVESADNRLLNNTLSRNGRHGVFVDGSPDRTLSGDNELVGNRVANNGEHGVVLAHTAGDRVRNGSVVRNDLDGIVLRNATGVAIANATTTDNDRWAVNLSDGTVARASRLRVAPLTRVSFEGRNVSLGAASTETIANASASSRFSRYLSVARSGNESRLSLSVHYPGDVDDPDGLYRYDGAWSRVNGSTVDSDRGVVRAEVSPPADATLYAIDVPAGEGGAMEVLSTTPPNLTVGSERTLVVHGRNFSAGTTVVLRRGNRTIEGEVRTVTATRVVADFEIVDASLMGEWELVVRSPTGRTVTRDAFLLPGVSYPVFRPVGRLYPVGRWGTNYVEVGAVSTSETFMWVTIEPPAPGTIKLRIRSPDGEVLWDSRKVEDPSTARVLVYVPRGEVTRLALEWKVPADAWNPGGNGGLVGAGLQEGVSGAQTVTVGSEGGIPAGQLREKLRGKLLSMARNAACKTLGEAMANESVDVQKRLLDNVIEELKGQRVTDLGDIEDELQSEFKSKVYDALSRLGNVLGPVEHMAECFNKAMKSAVKEVEKHNKQVWDEVRRKVRKRGSRARRIADAFSRTKGPANAGRGTELYRASNQARRAPCNEVGDSEDVTGGIFGSYDPNDKLGDTGYPAEWTEVNGTRQVERRVIPPENATDPVRYVVRFENLPEATAPARSVTITDELDGNLNLSSFRVVGASHPEKLSVDREGRTVTFRFENVSIPPNDDPPEGEGYVVFTVRPKPGLDPGTEITNDASIVFDSNPPIDTDEVVHVIGPVDDGNRSNGTTDPARAGGGGLPLLGLAGVLVVVGVLAAVGVYLRREDPIE